MRIDPNYILNLASAVSQSSVVEENFTQQLSSGLRVTSLSDDPVAAAQSSLMASSRQQADSFVQTSTREQSLLQVTDLTLGEVVSQLTSAISLSTRAVNGTFNSSDSAAMGSQMAGVRDQILALANSSYLGLHLFSGSQASTVSFALNTSTTPASATYQGDAKTQSIETLDGQKVQVNVAGSTIFSAPGADVLGTLNAIVADLASGNTSALAGYSTTLSAALANVSQQRSVLNTSLAQLTSTTSYVQTQQATLAAQQSALLSADPASIATNLKNAEVQHQALLSVIAAVDHTNLFDYLK